MAIYSYHSCENMTGIKLLANAVDNTKKLTTAPINGIGNSLYPPISPKGRKGKARKGNPVSGCEEMEDRSLSS